MRKSVTAISIPVVSSADGTWPNAGQLHGVINDGAEPLTFTSVVAPIGAGYELAMMK